VSGKRFGSPRRRSRSSATGARSCAPSGIFPTRWSSGTRRP